jgi:chromate transport protein ChrA
MAQTVAASILVERVPLGALFLACLKVSLLGLGGSLVWARRIVVDQKRWMDDREFADTLTLCQFMPGPHIVGITVCVGSRLRGSIGAIPRSGVSSCCPGWSGCRSAAYASAMSISQHCRTSSAGSPLQPPVC